MGMIASVTPKTLEKTFMVYPSKRLISNNRATVSKKSGNKKNRHLFILPGMLQTDVPVGGGSRAKRSRVASTATPSSSQVPQSQGDDAEGVSLTQTQTDTVKQDGSSLQIGSISNLDTPNPTLHLKMNDGVLKLIGTIVYPKNRFITLQCPNQSAASSSTGNMKDVEIDNSFDNAVIFTKAAWISDADRAENKPFPPPVSIPHGLKTAVSCDSDEAVGGFIQTGPTTSKSIYVPPTEEEEQAEKELEAVSIEQQDIMNVFGDEDDDDKGTSEPPQRKVERSSSRKRAVVNYAEKDDSTSEEDE